MLGGSSPQTYSLNAQYFITVLEQNTSIKESGSVHSYCEALKGLRAIAVVADCLTQAHQDLQDLDNKHNSRIDKIQEDLEVGNGT